MKRLWIMLLLVVEVAFAQHVKLKWTHLGPFETPKPDADSGNITPTGMGWIEAIGYARSALWASSNSGGLYKSIDQGKNWQCVKFDNYTFGVLDININPADENDIIISTGTTVGDNPYGIGIRQTIDGGQTWHSVGLSFMPHQKQAVWQCQRLDKDQLVAVTQDKIWLISTRDKTHELLWQGDIKLRQLLKHPTNPNYLYASGNKLLISHDKGKSWEDKTMQLLKNQTIFSGSIEVSRIAISTTVQQPDYLYACYQHGNINYIQLSRDAGKTWQVIGMNRTFGRFDINHAELLVDPEDTLVMYAGAVRMYKSIDGANSFELISNPVYGDRQFMHDDIRDILINERGEVFCANDGGISKSVDRGKTWQSINGKGLTVTQVYDMAVNPLNDKDLMLGCQDLSTMLYRKGKWMNTSRVYGDGGPCLFWPTQPFKAIISQNAQLLYSDNEALSWNSLGNPELTNKLFFPLVNDPFDAHKIYAGWYHVWMKDGADWWTNLSKNIDGNGFVISSISVVKSHEFMGYFSFDQPVWQTGDKLKGKLFKGIKVGEEVVWKDLTPNLPITAWRGITALAAVPHDTLQLWVGYEGLSEDQDKNLVFYSADGGETFVDISKGLPGVHINKLMVTKRRKTHVWAATDFGLYYFKNDQWIQVSKKPVTVIVKDFEFSLNKKRIFVSTYGSGCYAGKVRWRYRR